jgi:DNA-binding GntR family transcriptional regulator
VSGQADGVATEPKGQLAPTPSTPVTVLAAPLADQVFDTLREWIVNGHLQPGYRLRVRDVAALVGTSVMPVREAIRRLVETGLAIHEPYKGASVRALDVGELEQAYDVRILLEGECARLGAIAADEQVVDRMNAEWTALQRATQDGDIREALLRDERLLDVLYTAAGNDVACEVIRGLWDKCRPYKVLWVTEAAGRGDLEMWHYKPELIAAAQANDGAEAERILRTSYASAKDSLRALLAGR